MSSCFNGRSGAKVRLRKGKIIKSASPQSVSMQLKWYTNNPYTSPKTKKLSDTTYMMEFLTGSWAASTPTLWEEVIKIPLTFKELAPIEGYSGTYHDYVEYSATNLPRDLRDKVVTTAKKFNYTENTFCHGDLVLTHVVKDDFDNICLIDPSIKEGIWNSWMIDVGRLMTSFRSDYDTKFMGGPVLEGKEKMIPTMKEIYGLSMEEMLVQEMLIHCRTYKYQYIASHVDGLATEREIINILGML